MMEQHDFDAVVIGGAASGATFALRMARAGWNVAVVEKSSFPRRKVCGEFLSATNQPLFEDLELLDRINSQSGHPVTHVAIYESHRIVKAPMPAIHRSPDFRGSAVGRDKLDLWLMEKAVGYGATAFQPAKVVGLSRQGMTGQVQVQTDAGEEWLLRAPVVVAAHGSWGASGLSTFPESRPSRPSDLFGFKAHFLHGNLEPGLMPLFVFPGGYGGLVESDGGRVSFSACVRRDVLARIRQTYRGRIKTPGEALIQHLVDTVRGMRDVLEHATVDDKILSVGPIRPGIRSTYRDGVFRVGNAAGEAHPIIAEGVTLAMQSSWLLSEKWIRAGIGGDPDMVAAEYRQEWRRSFRTRILSSFLFARLAMNPHASGSAARLAGWFPGLISSGAALSGKARMVVA